MHKQFLKKLSRTFRRPILKEVQGIFTHLTDDEKIQLYKLSRSINRTAVCVEIGSYLGASSVLLAKGLRSGVLYCIDTWENDAMTEGRRNTYEEFEQNTEIYSHKIIPTRGWSSNVFAEIASKVEKIDLFFIDGDHSYEAVKKDWQLYSALLTKGSIVIFHDYGWADGVQRVIKENVVDCIEQYHTLPNMWWGVMK